MVLLKLHSTVWSMFRKRTVHNYDRAIECDKCKTWIHTCTSCATVSDDYYKVIQATNCTWICPTCNTANLSTSFSSSSSGIETSKPYQILMENRIPENDRSAQDKLQHTCRNINKMFSININGIRGRKLKLQAYLSTENPDIVALQETKID